MKITKPIVFFDLETTGTNISSDRICQFSGVKIFPEGFREEKNIFINPCVQIPEQASQVHGITNESVKDCPKFKDVANEISDWMKGSDLAGFNSNSYDIPLLIEEYNRIGVEFPSWNPVLVDVFRYEQAINPNTLTALYKKYTGNDMEGAHNAIYDVYATIAVFENQILDKDIDTAEISKISLRGNEMVDYAGKLYKKDGVIYWAFGKNINKPVLNDVSYIDWVLSSDFPINTKKILRDLRSKK